MQNNSAIPAGFDNPGMELLGWTGLKSACTWATYTFWKSSWKNVGIDQFKKWPRFCVWCFVLIMPWKAYIWFSTQFPVFCPWLSVCLSEQPDWEKPTRRVSWSVNAGVKGHSAVTSHARENSYLPGHTSCVCKIGLWEPLIKITGGHSGLWESGIHLFIHLFWGRICINGCRKTFLMLSGLSQRPPFPCSPYFFSPVFCPLNALYVIEQVIDTF